MLDSPVIWRAAAVKMHFITADIYPHTFILAAWIGRTHGSVGLLATKWADFLKHIYLWDDVLQYE